jgi:hypothetical protein
MCYMTFLIDARRNVVQSQFWTGRHAVARHSPNTERDPMSLRILALALLLLTCAFSSAFADWEFDAANSHPWEPASTQYHPPHLWRVTPDIVGANAEVGVFQPYVWGDYGGPPNDMYAYGNMGERMFDFACGGGLESEMAVGDTAASSESLYMNEAAIKYHIIETGDPTKTGEFIVDGEMFFAYGLHDTKCDDPVSRARIWLRSYPVFLQYSDTSQYPGYMGTGIAWPTADSGWITNTHEIDDMPYGNNIVFRPGTPISFYLDGDDPITVYGGDFGSSPVSEFLWAEGYTVLEGWDSGLGVRIPISTGGAYPFELWNDYSVHMSHFGDMTLITHP